jgi:hypothetical protein
MPAVRVAVWALRWPSNIGFAKLPARNNKVTRKSTKVDLSASGILK